MSPEPLLQDLQQRGYLQYPFPLEKQAIQQAMAAFFAFLEEEDSVKQHIDFSIATHHRRGDVGFKRRLAEDHIYNDNKEFFHYHPALLERYADFITQHEKVAHFMALAKPIWDLAYSTVYTILQALEPSYPGVVNKIFATDTPHILLRFLKYEWQQSGKYLAKPHFDAGSFTLAIAESCPGLRIGRGPEDLRLVEHKEGHALFMVSSNFQKIIQTDTLFPGWHDVIQLDEQHIGQPFARWALVAFIEGVGVEALPRTETHKWVTEKELVT